MASKTSPKSKIEKQEEDDSPLASFIEMFGSTFNSAVFIAIFFLLKEIFHHINIICSSIINYPSDVVEEFVIPATLISILIIFALYEFSKIGKTGTSLIMHSFEK